ncbi:DNA polymerase III subunit beta [Candidatus Zixiibacteriota bacterium]
MKFTVERAQFLPAVQAVLNVVSSKATLPIISNILIQLEGKQLSLYATDLDTSIRTKLPISEGEKGAIALPAKKLSEIVRELPEGQIEIQVDDKKATIRYENGHFNLMGMDSEDFPPFPEPISGQSFTVNQSLLAEMIHKTLYSTSKDETRPALQGVLWHVDEKEMLMVATDGHRLARVTLSKGGPAGFTKDIIIPSKTLNQLLRLFGEEEVDVEVSVTENQMIFSIADTTLYSRLIEGPYPDYTQVIPADSDKKLTVDREILHTAIRRVSTLSNALTHQVKFDLSKKRVLLSASDRDVGGEAQVELKADYSGDDLQIGYNAHPNSSRTSRCPR